VGRKSDGQLEIILLVPLLLAVLLLNITIIQSIGERNNELLKMKAIYDRLALDGNYTTDPATGNIYP
jgi:hypothetical protein